MKEMFKKGFGIIMGIYAGSVCAIIVDKYLEPLYKNDSKESAKKNEETEEA